MNHTVASETGIGRRDFLILGSVATVGVAASVSAGTASPLSVLTTSNPFLSVGFLEAENDSVAAANRLRAGFSATHARVRIQGLSRANADRNATTIDVTAFFKAGDSTVPYLAWSHAAGATSPAVSFNVPVDETGHLALGIEQRSPSVLRQPARRVLGRFFGVRPAAGELPQIEKLVHGKSLCRLNTSAGDGLKLRRGTYFVALLQEGDSKPNWSAITARPLSNEEAAPLRRGNAPVDFDYLVLSVDHA